MQVLWFQAGDCRASPSTTKNNLGRICLSGLNQGAFATSSRISYSWCRASPAMTVNRRFHALDHEIASPPSEARNDRYFATPRSDCRKNQSSILNSSSLNGSLSSSKCQLCVLTASPFSTATIRYEYSGQPLSLSNCEGLDGWSG